MTSFNQLWRPLLESFPHAAAVLGGSGRPLATNAAWRAAAAALSSDQQPWIDERLAAAFEAAWSAAEDRTSIAWDGADGALRLSRFEYEDTPFALAELVRSGADGGASEREALAALRESEALLRTTIESVPFDFWATDASGRYVLQNASSIAHWGHNVGRRPEDVPGLPADVLADWLRTNRRALDGEVVQDEVSLVTNGERRYYTRILAPVREAGTVRGTLGVNIDVTETRRLEQQQRRLVAVLEATSDFVSMATPDGQVTYINRAGRRLVGIDEDAPLDGMKVGELHPPATFRRLAESAIPIALEQGHWTGESELLARDGRSIPVSQVIIGHTGADGRPQFLSTIMRDTTQQHAAARALRESEARLRRMVENLPVGAALREDRQLFVNAAVERMTGFSRTELDTIEKWTANLFRDDPDAARTLYRAERAAGFPNAQVHPIRRRDGQLRYIEFAAFRYEGGEVWLLNDITERRWLEAQLRQAQKMESIGRLAGGIAHDFNNLLTAVLGYADLALDSLPPDAPERVYLGTIHEAGQRGASLVGQLLAFARKQVTAPRVVDLGRLVIAFEQMLRRIIGEHIELVVDVAPDLGRVKIDPGQFEQVLANLAVNARDAMPQGGRLTIRAENVHLESKRGRPVEHGPGRYVRLTIEDTGVGMSEDVLSRLFEPFFTTKAPGKGTGLGLSTCYGIVRQAGGQIEAESAPGQGAAFRIDLPSTTEPEDPLPAATAGPAATGHETILLVEDERLVRTLAVTALSARGYTVIETQGGAEALEASRAHPGPIHLLVTDVVMPGMSGRELARQLAAERPDVRVLFISGYATEDSDDTQRDHFLAKPFTPAELAAGVRTILDLA